MKKPWSVLLLCLLLAGCAASSPTREEPGPASETVAQPEPDAEPAADPEPETEPEAETGTETVDLHAYDFTVRFAGDINLDENWDTTLALDARGGDISSCIDPDLIDLMQSADIMCLNNEFSYSDRGSPLDGKAYTFRASPDRVAVLQTLGVDVVTLANNHVYDYGPDALLDTLDTLTAANIPYFGAGRDLTEAMTPVYLEVDGKTVAFVGASRAEKYPMTPQATESTAGILRCYDTELFLDVIAEARANADFVIAYVHWGTEYSYELEDVQVETGRLYLDAGCDIVIGAHSHCLQGMEYYGGKPIVYSLGNYWFNSKTLDTMLLELRFSGDDTGGSLELTVIPAVQSDCTTRLVTGDEAEHVFDLLESISVNISIDGTGAVAQSG